MHRIASKGRVQDTHAGIRLKIDRPERHKEFGIGAVGQIGRQAPDEGLAHPAMVSVKI
jgi:hypothetical protein